MKKPDSAPGNVESRHEKKECTRSKTIVFYVISNQVTQMTAKQQREPAVTGMPPQRIILRNISAAENLLKWRYLLLYGGNGIKAEGTTLN